jgi:oligosaccharide repeat unit polymerase
LVLGAIGPVLLFEENRRRRWQFTALAMAPTLAVSLFYGTRYVAFSAVILALTAIGMRHRRSGAMRLALVAVLLIPIGAIVKEARAGNVNSLDEARAVLTVKEPNPLLEFPEEIGQGFTPVAGIIQSTTNSRSGGYRYGRTFVGAALTVVPSGPRLAGIEVDRPTFDLSAELLGDGYYQEGLTVGYSLIAELFLNFGAWGVVFGMALIGWALGAAYRASIVRDRPALLFALWAVMGFALYAARNDAFTTLRYMVWGALIFWLAARWDKRRTARGA